MTKEEEFEFRFRLEQEQGQSRKEDTTSPVLRAESPIESGFLMGLKDPISGGAQLLPRGLEQLTSGFGYAPNTVSEFFGGEAERVDQMVKAEEASYQQAREQRGEEGFDTARLAGNVINPANLAVAARAAQVLKAAPTAVQAIGTGMATGALQPITSTEDFGTDKAIQTGLAGVGGVVGSKLTQVAGRILNPLVTKAEKTMRELGVTLTPGQMLGKGFKTIEEFAENIPLIGGYISNAKERQLFQFNKGVINRTLRKLDDELPEDVIGRDAIEHVNTVVDSQYAIVLSKISLNYDKELAGKIGAVIPQSKVASAAGKQELADQLDNLIYSKIPVDKNVNAKVSGETFKEIESDINKQIMLYSKSQSPTDNNIANALRDALKVLRTELSSQNPTQAVKLNKINSVYGDIVVMRTAASNSGAVNGVFTPKQYQSAVRQRDVSRNKGSFAAGKAKGQQIGDAGTELLTPDAGATQLGRMTLGAAGGYGALQNPYAAAALVITTPAIYSKAGLKLMETLATKRPDVARSVGKVLSARAPREGSITGAQIMEEFQRQSNQ
tara:strand:- start:45 stop:1709 length:1665 start_codon:yes stop_codon:yes gene_type:complete